MGSKTKSVDAPSSCFGSGALCRSGAKHTTPGPQRLLRTALELCYFARKQRRGAPHSARRRTAPFQQSSSHSFVLLLLFVSKIPLPLSLPVPLPASPSPTIDPVPKYLHHIYKESSVLSVHTRRRNWFGWFELGKRDTASNVGRVVLYCLLLACLLLLVQAPRHPLQSLRGVHHTEKASREIGVMSIGVYGPVVQL